MRGDAPKSVEHFFRCEKSLTILRVVCLCQPARNMAASLATGQLRRAVQPHGSPRTATKEVARPDSGVRDPSA
jgi:hypothetical protein